MQSQPQHDDIDIRKIQLYPQAPVIPDEAVADLAAEIAQSGIRGFCVVRLNLDSDSYTLIAGVTLYLALKRLGYSKIPCLLRNLPESEALAETLREIVRSGRHDFEEGLAYRIGMERCGWTTRSIQKEFGRSEGHISEKLGIMAVYDCDPRLLLAREKRMLSDRAVVGLRRILRLPIPPEEQLSRIRTIADRLLADRWPATIAASMVTQCLEALDQGLPLPPPPERGRRLKTALANEISALESRRNTLAGQVDEIEAVLSALRSEEARMRASVASFDSQLKRLKKLLS